MNYFFHTKNCYLVPAHFKSSFHAVTARRGQPVEIQCEAHGEPPIQLHWSRDRSPFQPHQQPRYQLIDQPGDRPSDQPTDELPVDRLADRPSAQPDDRLMDQPSDQPAVGVGGTSRFVQRLRIAQSDRRDSALFTCTASNPYGKDEYNVQVILQGEFESGCLFWTLSIIRANLDNSVLAHFLAPCPCLYQWHFNIPLFLFNEIGTCVSPVFTLNSLSSSRCATFLPF